MARLAFPFHGLLAVRKVKCQHTMNWFTEGVVHAGEDFWAVRKVKGRAVLWCRLNWPLPSVLGEIPWRLADD